MKRLYALFALLVLAALALGPVPATSGNGPACVLNTHLAGENEIPRGTSDATGHAQIKIWSDGTLAWKVHILNKDGEAIRAGHIHEAASTEAGPVIIPLFDGPTTTVRQFRDSGTTTVDPGLAAEICAEPAEYYVNYHSDENPPGMARGQLG
jgi:CHRD domain